MEEENESWGERVGLIGGKQRWEIAEQRSVNDAGRLDEKEIGKREL